MKCQSAFLVKLLISLVLVVISVDKCRADKSLKDKKFELRGKRYPLEIYPVIDDLKIEEMFERKRYMKFLLKCVFFEGPCDLVGKWLKPRTLPAFRGQCPVCTQNQSKKIENWLLLLVKFNEDLFRIAMIKICLDMNIPVSMEEKRLAVPYFTQDDFRDYILLNKPWPS